MYSADFFWAIGGDDVDMWLKGCDEVGVEFGDERVV
jgi:hypothetical protein